MRTIGWLLLAGTAVTAAATPPGVRIDARAVQPGEVLSITISGTAAADAPRVRVFGRTIPVFGIGDSAWRALAGIDLDVTPGSYVVDLETGPAAQPVHTTRQVVVRRKVFQTRRLRVPEGYVNPPPEVEARIASDAARLTGLFGDASTPRLWHGAFTRPVDDPANSAFGSRSILNGQPRSPHGGTDFLSAAGTLVHAPNAGRVVLVDDLYYTGQTIVIDHGQGLISLFAHLSATSVAPGATVAAGDVIGRVGSTGRVTGPHLHWTVRLGTARVDPLSLLAIADDAADPEPATRPAPPRRPAAAGAR